MNVPSTDGDEPLAPMGIKDILLVRVREGIRPALFSAMVPGIGQILKGESWRGMTMVSIAALMLLFSILSYDVLRAAGTYPQAGGHTALVLVAFLPYIAIWSYSVLDAAFSLRRATIE